MIVGDAVSFELSWRQASGHVDRHCVHAELLGGLVPGMANYDHTVFIDHDRLPKTKFMDGLGHGVDGGVVEARIVFIRTDIGQLARFDLHGFPFRG